METKKRQNSDAGARAVGFLFKLVARVFLYFWCAFSVFSLLWIIVSSLKTNREFFENAWGLFETPQWNNYIEAWTKNSLSNNFMNSIYVVGMSVLLVLIIATPAAYVLSRIHFPGMKAVHAYVIAGMGIPVQLILVPLYFIMNQIKLVNSLNGLILVYVAISLPFTVFLEMGFFRTLPSALVEAAYIDGSSPMYTFFKIMLPLGVPGIVTSALFNFISLWNEFMIALTFLTTNEKFTLPVGIYSMQAAMQYVGKWTTLLAGLVIVIIPTLLIYLVLSRQIIEGLTMGAVKE